MVNLKIGKHYPYTAQRKTSSWMVSVYGFCATTSACLVLV